MSKIFDVVAFQFELEDGITKEQAIDLINQLPEGRIIPFFTSANNTSAAGFIAHNVFEKFEIEEMDELIIKFIETIIEDTKKENEDGFYNFNGVSISLQYKPSEIDAHGTTECLDMNGNIFIPIEDKEVIYDGNRYSIYEDHSGCTEINAISIDGKTLQLKRSENYGKEYGYVVEAMRMDGNKFKYSCIWLCVEGRGWQEADTIKDEREVFFIQNILKEYGIELVDETTTEMCSHCMKEQEIPTNRASMCTCGDVIFPCSTCDEREGKKGCDWNKDKGCWRFSYYSALPVKGNTDRTGCIGDLSEEYQTKRKCCAELLCKVANRLQVVVCATDLWDIAATNFKFTSEEFLNEGTGGEFEWYVPTETELEVMKSCF